MLNRKESSGERVEELVLFASWLKEEAQALKGVIETVPYKDQIPERKSIEEELNMLLFLQRTYYRPIFEEFRSSDFSKEIQVPSAEMVLETAEREEGSQPIQNILDQLTEQRTQILHLISQIREDDWGCTVKTGSEDRSLQEIAEEMVERDLETYQRLADLVKTFQQEAEAKRELKVRHPGNDEVPQNQNPSSSASVE
ncbi:MAG: hypothetical protein WD315_00240 [Balneolaceae bacterium]